MDVVVVGAGVVGLSVAVRLADVGHRVRVVARDLPAATTSAVAAAIWYPYRAAPAARVSAWAGRTYAVLADLAADGTPGVAIRDGLEVFRAPTPDPWWRDAVPGFARATGDALPAGYADGYALRLPIVAMSAYLPWLTARAEAGGGRVEQRALTDLDGVLDEADAVVDCAGLGARELAADPSLTPVRGQVVVVRNPGLERFWLDGGHPDGVTYVVPRGADCVVGGTADEGVDDLAIDPATTAAILRRGAGLEPALAGAEVLAVRVGLRPVRPSVRLDVEDRPGGRIVHCYGHGGAGVTLSWGCAEEVATLLR